MPSTSATSAAAKQAYERAVELYKLKHTSGEDRKRWLKDANSIQDIHDAITAAKAKYDSVPHSKARRWLAKFSGGVMYYAQIGDMLAQSNPEYVSLAWGTMKLIFVLVTNHEGLLSELARALSRISDVLPRTEIHPSLYPTNAMQTATEELYTHLISFYSRALRWYESSSLHRVVKSFVKPFALEFDDIVKQVMYSARSIESLAITMAHKEIREMHVILKDCLADRETMRLEYGAIIAEAKDMQQYRQKSMKLLADLQQTLISHQTINSGVMLTTQRITQETQVTLMIGATSSLLAIPLDALRQCKSLLRWRSDSRFAITQVWHTQPLKTWSLASSSSLLVLVGTLQLKRETRSIGVYIIELLRSSNMPILWALKGFRKSSVDCSTTDLLKYIVRQALQLDLGAIGEKVSPHFNSARVAAASTEDDWLRILEIALSGTDLVYLVIDSEILGTTVRQQHQLSAWISLIQGYLTRQTSTVVKVVVLNYRKSSIKGVLQACRKAGTYALYLDSLARGQSTETVASRSGRTVMRSGGAINFRATLRNPPHLTRRPG